MKHYIWQSKTYDTLPDPLHLNGGEISPMTEKLFVQLGGTIEDDGEPTPSERVIAELNAAVKELAEQVKTVTIAEFKEAASTLYSGGLIAWAKSRGVPDEIITGARVRIVEILADALRIGMTWETLIDGIEVE